MNDMTYQLDKVFPSTDTLPDLEYVSKSQCFPLYWNEKIELKQNGSSTKEVENQT